ncbi:DUF5339 family protein [Providencia sp. PROV202]|uniref:DUF5339 family protein n=1 Tax=Providencia sp. PROV202 TaxID=2949902 RepID=UPI0023495EC4|nr:DUF5339 family protein [Providencia sp. PROV202]
MKKYLLSISLAANAVLLIALFSAAVMLFNLKAKVDNAIQQVKDGEYIELAKDNILPDSLKDLSKIDVTDKPCDYFYQNVDVFIEYLKDNPDIAGADIYANQIAALKRKIEKAPSIFQDKACEKGISGLNFMIETISPSE